MPEPQPVFKPLTRSAIFLVVTVHEGGEQTVRDLLTDVPGITRSVGFRVPEGELSCVAAIGSDCWDRLFAGPRPAELHPLPELVGPAHTAVSTPGDLLFHLRSRQMDLCFELASQLMNRLRGVATVIDETHGFKYFEERDLMGFVDGTENPVGPSAVQVAVITDQDPNFVGGSYVIVQKYLHDLVAWNELPTEEQELAMGRTKPTNMELPDDVKPANSHVALTSIEEPDGTELQIVRDNMPFGRVGTEEFGTYFIGYSATPAVTERMLRNMFLGDPPGNTDRILEFSTAITGTLFFVPSVDFLEDLPDLPGMPAPATGDAGSSLGIGGMKNV